MLNSPGIFTDLQMPQTLPGLFITTEYCDFSLSALAFSDGHFRISKSLFKCYCATLAPTHF